LSAPGRPRIIRDYGVIGRDSGGTTRGILAAGRPRFILKGALSPELAGRAGAARVGRLATVGPDGAPHLVPICFVLDGDVLYTAVDQKPKRSRDLQRLRNLRERPAATVLVDHYQEDWTGLW
jgi:hypothetical protein